MAQTHKTIRWTFEAAEAFEEMKRQVAKAISTSYYDPEDETFIYIDASDKAVGCVLTQKDKEGKTRIIACHMKGIVRCHKFVIGCQYTLVIDAGVYKHIFRISENPIQKRQFEQAVTRLFKSKDIPVRVSRNLFFEREPLVQDNVTSSCQSSLAIRTVDSKLPESWKSLIAITDEKFKQSTLADDELKYLKSESFRSTMKRYQTISGQEH